MWDSASQQVDGSVKYLYGTFTPGKSYSATAFLEKLSNENENKEAIARIYKFLKHKGDIKMLVVFDDSIKNTGGFYDSISHTIVLNSASSLFATNPEHPVTTIRFINKPLSTNYH